MELKNFIEPTVLLSNYETSKNEAKKFQTTDFVYLSSYDEIKKLPRKLRIAYPTDYAVLNDAEMAYRADGAVLNRTEMGYRSDNLTKRPCNTWLRSGSIGYVLGVNHDGKICFNSPYDTSVAIRPALRLNLSSVISARNESEDMFKIVKHEIGSNDNYYTIEFGEYPKVYVGEELNKHLEEEVSSGRLKATGKTFTKLVGYKGVVRKNHEYEYNGQKYVRVFSTIYNYDSECSDGSVILQDKTPCWLKVEPITWIITNWRDMPKEINPKGKGNAKTIDILAEEAILCGMPFFPSVLYNGEDLEDIDEFSRWQSSIIRSYLNGYNTHQEIDNGNGNKDYKARQNFDFTKHNFLTEAFSNERYFANIKSPNNINVSKSDKQLSIDEQIKLYIEKGKSFMLHGPSDVGKTRRIEESDPEFVSIVLRNGILPEEVIGKTIYLSDDKTKAGKWVAPAWYQDLCEKCAKEPNKKHVLFIDKMTKVRPSEQSLVSSLLNNNSVGPNVGKLPQNAVIVVADNIMEEKSPRTLGFELLFSKFDTHVYLNQKSKNETKRKINQTNKTKDSSRYM